MLNKRSMTIDILKLKYFFITFLALVLAVCYPNLVELFERYKFATNVLFEHRADVDLTVKRNIINAWAESILEPNENLKITIGMNTNVDLILSAIDLLKELHVKDELPANYHAINSLEQFKSCFKYFFKKGSAAERAIINLDDFDHIVNLTQNLNKQLFIGGNAALMAQGIAKRSKNNEILLFGPIGPKLKELLDDSIKIPETCFIEKDQIHLIMEYNDNDVYEDIKTPHSNRFIVSHDTINSRLELLDEFFNFTSYSNSDIIILSGLHLLESQSEDIRNERLNKLNELLLSNQKKNIIHLELASIGDKNLMKDIIDSNLLKSINSLGLNEQELLFLAYSDMKAPHNTYYNELHGHPDLSKIVDIVEWIFDTFGQVSNADSKLTRIHFHCLPFHLIAEIDLPNEPSAKKTRSRWSNTKSSLLGGSKIASKQACNVDFDDESQNQLLASMLELRLKHEYDPADGQVLLNMGENKMLKLNSSDPVIEFRQRNVKFYLTPILVCKKPLKTVGLGDAISSNGLLYSKFHHAV